VIDLTAPLSREEAVEMADALARRVVGMGLSVPAILMLEMHRPLSRLAGQALVAATPVLGPALGAGGVQKLARLLYHPGGIELMIDRIEELRDARKEASR
jgi:hypothetical protein